MIFHPDRGNCIETLARSKYRELMSKYFEDGSNETLEKIELLTKFLETADFSELRRRFKQ